MHTSKQVTHAIVVLGFELNDNGTLKPGLKHRLDMGAELYRQDTAPIVITSGWYPVKDEHLSRYCESYRMAHYLRDVHGNDIRVMFEPDSTSVPENLLFTYIRFPNLQQLTVVAGELFMERAEFFASMIFAGRVAVRFQGCKDGTGDPEKQLQLIGDAKCTLKDMTPGDLDFLLLPPGPNGELRSRWNELRLAHHECPYWGRLHP